MNSDSDHFSLVETLAEEFLERQQRGEKPTIGEYCQRHPELADEIREVLEAVAMMEELKPDSKDATGTAAPGPVVSSGAPERVGDYRILREIGRGGMGVVYEAEQVSLGRRVAVKILPRSTASDQAALARFQREARAAARMHHTNIVPVFEVGDTDNVVFYAMQLIHGQGLDLVIDDLRNLRSERSGAAAGPESIPQPPAHSLAASLVNGHFEKQSLAADSDPGSVAAESEDSPESAAPQSETHGSRTSDSALTRTLLLSDGSTRSAVLPGQSDIASAEDNHNAYFQSVAQIGLQTASALSYAHARGIVHRDIKPSNLLLDSTGVVWVTDFGLAKTSDSAMTHTGDILGTLRYMSPERFKGQCDVRADVYSLGLTLYELLVLKPAFSSPDRLKLIDMVTRTEAAPPRSIDARIPRDLETIVLKACDREPRRRYQSADELADDLQRFVHDEPIQARRISLIERFSRWSRRNKALAGSLTALALALIVIAGFALERAKAFSDEATVARRDSNTAALRLEEEIEAKRASDRAAEASRRRTYDSDMQTALGLLKATHTSKGEILDILIGHEEANIGLPQFDMKNPDAPYDLRDFRFHYLKTALERPVIGRRNIRYGRNWPYRSLCFGQSGTVLSLSKEGRLSVWGERTDRPIALHRLATGTSADVRCVELSVDGGLAAIASRTGNITVYDNIENSPLAALTLDIEGVVLAMEFVTTEDGKRGLAVVSTHAGHRLRPGPSSGKSPDSRRTNVVVENSTEHALDFFWRDAEGELHQRFTVRPGRIAEYRTFIGHVTEVRVQRSGDCLGHFIPDTVHYRLLIDGVTEPAPPAPPAVDEFGYGHLRLDTFDVTSGELLASRDGVQIGDKRFNPGTVYDIERGQAAVDISRDGTAMAVAEVDQWNIRWRHHADQGDIPVRTTSFRTAISADARTIVAGSSQGTLRVLDRNGFRDEVKEHVGAITAIEFSPSEDLVATGGMDGLVNVFRLLEGRPELVHQLKGHRAPIKELKFDVHGTQLAAATINGELSRWSLTKDHTVTRWTSGTCWGVDISADSKLLATIARDHCAIWNLNPFFLRQRVEIGCMSCAFSPNSDVLAIGGVDRIQLLDLTTGDLTGLEPQFPEEAAGFGAGVGCVSFSPDGRFLVTGFGGNTQIAARRGDFAMLVWDVATGKQVHQVAHEQPVVSADFSPDGRLLATVDEYRAVMIHTVPDDPAKPWALPRRIDDDVTESFPGPVSVEFAPDGTFLAVGGNNGRIQLFDTKTWKMTRSLGGNRSHIMDLKFSTDGRRIISCGSDNLVRMRDLETGRMLFRLPVRDVAVGLALSPDERWLVSAEVSNGISLWSAMPPTWATPQQVARKFDSTLDAAPDIEAEAIVRAIQRHPETLAELTALRGSDRRMQLARSLAAGLRRDIGEALAILKTVEDGLTVKDAAANERLTHLWADAIETRLFGDPAWKNVEPASLNDFVIRRGQMEVTVEVDAPIAQVGGMKLVLVPLARSNIGGEGLAIRELTVQLIGSDGNREQIPLTPGPAALGTGLDDVADGNRSTAFRPQLSTGGDWVVLACAKPVETAGRRLKLTIQLAPGSGACHLRLALRADTPDMAVLTTAHLLRHERHKLPALVRLAAAFTLAGDADRAEQVYEIARRTTRLTTERSQLMHTLRALIQHAQGNAAEAVASLEKATVVVPRWTFDDFDSCLHQLALTRIRDLDADAAQQLWLSLTEQRRRAFLAAPSDDGLTDPDMRHRAAVLAAQGRWALAAQEQDRIVSFGAPDDIDWMTYTTLTAVAVLQGQLSPTDYRDACNRMVAEALRKQADPDVSPEDISFLLERTKKCCLLLEMDGIDFDQLPGRTWAEYIEETSDPNLTWSRPWRAIQKALEVQRHRDSGSVHEYTRLARKNLHAYPLDPRRINATLAALEGLAWATSGDRTQAQERLAVARHVLFQRDQVTVQGDRIASPAVGSSVQHDALICAMLIREAEIALERLEADRAETRADQSGR